MALPCQGVFLPFLLYGSSIAAGIFTTVTEVVLCLVTTDRIRNAHLRGTPYHSYSCPAGDLCLMMLGSPTPRRPQNRPQYLPPQSVSDEIPPTY